MSVRRIGVLLRREFKYGSRSYFFAFGVLGPLMVTAFIHLTFGSLIGRKPRLGIAAGAATLTASLDGMESIDVREYASEDELRDAVQAGARDVGIVLRDDFEAAIARDERIAVTVYIWGESLMKNRAIAGSAVMHHMRELSGRQPPVEVATVTLGEGGYVPWKDRMLPVIVLMAIFISGFAVPSTSLVDEKERRTITAVLTTPANQVEVFASKGLMGLTVSLTMGIVTLALNHAFAGQPGILIIVLFLGAVMACCFGLIMGALMSTVAAAYSVLKAFNFILYAPGLVAMFPRIPAWIGRMFPTYYVMHPIMEIARGGGDWSAVSRDVFILIGIDAVFLAVVGVLARTTRQQGT